MGREIRRVPPHWEHPKEEKYNYQKGITEERYKPMYERNFEKEAQEYIDNFKKFYEEGMDKEKECHFWEYEGSPPDRDYYINYTEEEATWYQLYETVSEGTPVSPPFETQQELADYLAENGDFWDQSRRKERRSSMPCDPWGKERAERFVFGDGWAPSMVFSSDKGLQSGVFAVTDLDKN
jgi:hypothetical protein